MDEAKTNIVLKQNEKLLGIYDFPMPGFPNQKIAVIKTKDGLRTEPVPNLMDLWQLPTDIEKP